MLCPPRWNIIEFNIKSDPAGAYIQILFLLVYSLEDIISCKCEPGSAIFAPVSKLKSEILKSVVIPIGRDVVVCWKTKSLCQGWVGLALSGLWIIPFCWWRIK